MPPFLSDALRVTEIVTAAAVLIAVLTRFLFRRGKKLEEP